jgi:hypothetical protein
MAKSDPHGGRATKSYHPLSGDLYTPLTPEVMALFERMREHCGSWREVCARSNTKLKVLRRLRGQSYGAKAISMSFLDRLITTTEVGSLDDYLWFTADDLVALGVWDKPADPIDGAVRSRKNHTKSTT